MNVECVSDALTVAEWRYGDVASAGGVATNIYALDVAL